MFNSRVSILFPDLSTCLFRPCQGPFPFKVSLRLETPTLLVFDDPLALSRCHLCACPTGAYVPDLRSLFAAPTRGLALLHQLDDACWQAVEANFLNDAPWAAATLSPAARALPRRQLRAEHVVRGLNFPPSQFQLHLQFLLPPLTPYHWGLHRAGKHFSAGRFFPFSFLVKALAALRDDEKGGVAGCLEMDAQTLCAAVLARTGASVSAGALFLLSGCTPSVCTPPPTCFPCPSELPLRNSVHLHLLAMVETSSLGAPSL